ncbi:hypothetical protein BD410DRAFT_781356 [Rickenella mellea]|uniref:DinB-like domain-containing protein n=1 Tax=Rickenella mellea TaxID=50990 RepID=A0A4Y7QP18_9AGAM|nr:hypothetical protein BD410DRAFT_781356 [Rickenella mellea]
MTPLERLLLVSRTVLQQAIDMLTGNISSDEQLSFQSNYIPGSTIGKHLRHARDHFVLLADSVAGSPPFVVTYDVRSRGTPMERSRDAAVEALQACIARLEEVAPRVALDQSMTLNAVTPHTQVLQTTFGRELWFAALHAVHHWSMIRVIAGEQNVRLEDSFGFAPSTLIYHGSDGPLAKSKI